jgi:ankyrin repeat protein
MNIRLAAAVCAVLVVAGLSAQSGPGTNRPVEGSSQANAADAWYEAVRGTDRSRIETLIAQGADVNARDRRGGVTPLMYAAALGSLDTMRLLLDKGADVNSRSAAGATALMWAAADPAKVRLLVERGADVTIVSESGRTALLLAAASDQSADTVRLLLQRGADAKVIDREQSSVLFAASFGNDSDTVRQLIAAGVPVNAANVAGNTPLMNAAGNGNLEVVQLLLKAGANVNAVAGPPMAKVKNGTIDLGGFTPLILASAFGPASVVKTLLDAGADVNAREARGMTPLMYAAATDHGDIDIARMLMAKGADLAVKSNAGETALDWATKGGHTTLAALLQKAGAPGTAAPAKAIPDAAPLPLRPSLDRGVALLERSSNTFFTNGACGACHSQNITDIAVAAARKARIRVNDPAAAQRAAGASAAFAATATRFYERFDGPALDILLYTLAGFAAAGHPADRATDALVFNVAAQQQRDGRWLGGGIPRPPIEDGDFTRTALAIRGLKAYAPPGRAAEMADRTRRAAAWLFAAKPLTTEDRSFRLLGLTWGGADDKARGEAARALIAAQRPDGGWSQRDEMASDAYATGLALFALQESGSAPTASVVARATSFLLSTQRADGSWYVRSRSAKFQPYFDGGFPYEHDQWISAMATGWATAALALTAF